MISNVLYENIILDAPEQWAVWIGPAQQSVSSSLCNPHPCRLTKIISQLEVSGPSGPQLQVDGPLGQLDFVLRALRALRPPYTRETLIGKSTEGELT